MDCCPIIYWLCVALTKMVVSDKSPLVMPRPTVPLADGDLLRHRNHMLNQTPPELYPTLQRVQGSLIVTHIWEVMVQLGTGPTGDHPHLSSSALVRYFPMKTPPPPYGRSSWGPQSVNIWQRFRGRLKTPPVASASVCLSSQFQSY